MNSPLDTLPLDVAASRFSALGSEQRLGVLRSLVRAGPEGLTIGDLGVRSGVTGSTLTHHLKILTQADLITQTRQGRSIVCACVDYDKMRTLSDFLLSQCCADCSSEGHDHG